MESHTNRLVIFATSTCEGPRLDGRGRRPQQSARREADKVSDTVIRSGLGYLYPKGYSQAAIETVIIPPTRRAESHDADVVLVPAIFMGAFFELARIAWGGAMLPDDPKTT